MKFDLGNTTFDLQATTVTELFDMITESHKPKATYTTHPQGRAILLERWDNESMDASHTETKL